MDIRRRANELDSKANTRAIDSLLNYETVKYFGNEEFEARRYDENLQKYESAAVQNEASLGLLNIGQSLHHRRGGDRADAARRRGRGRAAPSRWATWCWSTACLIQLYIPLNFLGMVYREIKQALLDLDRMFRLLTEHREVEDKPDACRCRRGAAAGRILERDSFSYEKARQILFDVRFRHSRRASRRGGRPLRLRQVDAGAAAVPLLRCFRRRNPVNGEIIAAT